MVDIKKTTLGYIMDWPKFTLGMAYLFGQLGVAQMPARSQLNESDKNTCIICFFSHKLV